MSSKAAGLKRDKYDLTSRFVVLALKTDRNKSSRIDVSLCVRVLTIFLHAEPASLLPYHATTTVQV